MLSKIWVILLYTPFFLEVRYSLVDNLLYQVTKTSHLTVPSSHCTVPTLHVTVLLSHLMVPCWGLFFRPTWHYFIGSPFHINILLIFLVNLFKAQNKFIFHRLSSHGPQDPYFKRRICGSHFLFINWDYNPKTSSTSTYGSSSNNESKLMAHITSFTLMASSFSNKSLYLHKMTIKPKVCHIFFGSWSKFMSLSGETMRVVVLRAKRYVQ